MAQQAIADMGIPAMWHGMAFDKVAGAAATRRDVWWHCHSQEVDTDVPHNRQNAVNNARKERMGFRFAIEWIIP